MLAKVSITTNHEPHFVDSNLWEKALVVRTGESVPRQEQDLWLERKLRRELPGIYRLLVDSAIRLHRRGDFLVPQSSIDLRDSAAHKSRPLQQFAVECFEPEPGFLESEVDVIAAYRAWCARTNHKALASIVAIKQELKAVFGLDGKRHRVTVNGQRYEAINGLKIINCAVGRSWKAQVDELKSLREAVKRVNEDRQKAERAAEEARAEAVRARAANKQLIPIKTGLDAETAAAMVEQTEQDYRAVAKRNRKEEEQNRKEEKRLADKVTRAAAQAHEAAETVRSASQQSVVNHVEPDDDIDGLVDDILDRVD